MSEFKPPEGVNFSCQNPVPIAALSKDLCKIAAFLQHKFLYVALQRFDDWWQHDGLHFDRGLLDWHALFATVGSPRGIYESMPGDDYVRIGVAASDGKWYLRFYATGMTKASSWRVIMILHCCQVLQKNSVKLFPASKRASKRKHPNSISDESSKVSENRHAGSSVGSESEASLLRPCDTEGEGGQPVAVSSVDSVC